MKKQTAFVFAAFIVVLIIFAIVIMWLTSGGKTETSDVTADPVTESSQPRQTQYVMPSETLEPTEVTPTATVAPTPTPTPAPTPEQVSGTVIGTGSFDSSTGAGINTHTVWTATEQSNGTVKLVLAVYVRSYTVEIGQRIVNISINGSTSSGTTRAFSVNAPVSQADTLIYSYSTNVDKGSTLSVAVDWNYKGQYSGKDLDVISSSADISIPA